MEAVMAQQQTDLSTLQANAEVFFRSYGLSFSDGMNALLQNWEKAPSKETQAAIVTPLLHLINGTTGTMGQNIAMVLLFRCP